MQALTQATCSEPAVYGIVLWFLARTSFWMSPHVPPPLTSPWSLRQAKLLSRGLHSGRVRKAWANSGPYHRSVPPRCCKHCNPRAGPRSPQKHRQQWPRRHGQRRHRPKHQECKSRSRGRRGDSGRVDLHKSLYFVYNAIVVWWKNLQQVAHNFRDAAKRDIHPMSGPMIESYWITSHDTCGPWY